MSRRGGTAKLIHSMSMASTVVFEQDVFEQDVACDAAVAAGKALSFVRVDEADVHNQWIFCPPVARL